jgi:ribosomal protein S13
MSTSTTRAPARNLTNSLSMGEPAVAGERTVSDTLVRTALQRLHGLSPDEANDIMRKVEIPIRRTMSRLTDQEALQIREIINRDYVTGDRSPRQAMMMGEIKFLTALGRLVEKHKVYDQSTLLRCLNQYATAYANGILPSTFASRRRNGWSMERAITTPARRIGAAAI